MSMPKEWPNVKEVRKPIQYRIHTDSLRFYSPQLKNAAEFDTVWTALFGPKGAKAHFERAAWVEDRSPDRGEEFYFIMIWKSEATGWAMLVNREEVGLISYEDITPIRNAIWKSGDKHAAVDNFIQQAPFKRRLLESEFE